LLTPPNLSPNPPQNDRTPPERTSRWGASPWLTGRWSLLRRRKRFVDQSKDTQFSDAWILLALLLTLLALAADNRFLTGAAAGLLVVAGVSGLWSALSLVGLEYERRFSQVRAFQGEQVTLTLTVRNRKPLPITWLNITDTFPASLPIDEQDVSLNMATQQGEFHTFWMLGALQQVTRRFTIHCTERGFHRFGPATLRTGDGFGFFGRKATLPAQQTLIVYPRLYPVTELGLPSKSPFGDRRAQGHLFEDPLRMAGVREWQSSDSLRRVHWKATARHQQMLSRVYEPSEEQQILVVLNVATLARHWHGTIPELLERAISVAGSLAAVAADERLAVGLLANGALPGSDQPIRLLPGRNPQQLVQILELLAAVTPFATGPVEALLLQEAPRLAWGATLVVVTAIAHDALLATLLELVDAGRRVVLFTLAQEPPGQFLPGVTVYHLPHLVEDLIAPERVEEENLVGNAP